MSEHTGVQRPGGRTAKTRRAVHEAVRTLMEQTGAEPSIPAVAEQSGVHATTIYRRWHTIESLLLDVAVEDLNQQSPVPITGDLRRDLTAYVHQLLASIRQRGSLVFFKALQSAASGTEHGTEWPAFVEPRVARFQAMLAAAGVTRVNAMRLVELVIAPAYFWAQLGMPLDPDHDTGRLVETALRECED